MVARKSKTSIPLYEQVYLKLRKDIVNGRYKAGTRLTEEDVSQMAGISRTPARDSLKRLAGEGFVEFTPKRGAIVIGNDKEELKTIWDIRAQVEGIAAAIAAQKARDEDKKRLRDRMKKAVKYSDQDDREKFSEELRKFDEDILEIANVRHLTRILGLITPIVSETVFIIVKEGLTDIEQRCKVHNEICEAICNNDPARAKELTIQHLIEWRDIFLRSYDEIIHIR